MNLKKNIYRIICICLFSVGIMGCMQKENTSSAVLPIERSEIEKNEIALEDITEEEVQTAEEQAETEDNNNETTLQQNVENITSETTMSQVPSFTELGSFLTIFRTHRLREYSAENIDYEKLLDFAYSYIKFEERGKVTSEGVYDVILKADIDEVLDLFFEKTVPTENFGEYLYADGKFYYPAADSGDIGLPLAVVDEIETNEEGNYNVTFYEVYVYFEDFESGLTNPTDWNAYYEYNMEQVRNDDFCEIERKMNCVLKWQDDRFVLLEYRAVEENVVENEDAEIDIIDYLFQEVPELGDYADYISRSSNEQAILAMWIDREETFTDKDGTTHSCQVVYVGESWPDRMVNWDWFYIDKESLEIFWYSEIEGSVYTLDEWRRSVYYRNL